MPGTAKAVNIDGKNYKPTGEGEITIIGGVFENSPIPHSGGAGHKQVRRADGVTSVPLFVTDNEFEELKAVNNRPPSDGPGFPWRIETTEGNIYRATGFINLQNRTGQEGTATIDFYSKAKEGVILT